MPELPEVETIVRDLAPHLIGSTLHNPRLHHPDVLRGVTRSRFLATLAENAVADVTRRAKHVVLRLLTDHRVVVQPRMTGSLTIHRGAPTADARRYAVLEIEVDAGARLVYRDVRRLGTMHLLEEPAWEAYTERIGPEPLDHGFTADRFAACLRGSRQAIKKVLMDQRRIAGIGNIYAAEALFRAGIDPSRRADRLNAQAVTRLHGAVCDVLRAAVVARGTTVRDYRTGTGGRGSFQTSLDVYDRAGEPCIRCGTRLASTHAIDGRQTTFCWRCQGRA